MDKIAIVKALLDVDGFYDLRLKFISNKACIKCSMYIYEDEIKQLKSNAQLMYNFKLSNFSFEYEAIG